MPPVENEQYAIPAYWQASTYLAAKTISIDPGIELPAVNPTLYPLVRLEYG
jgi:hypothetical protein